jgi:hypothetical protein
VTENHIYKVCRGINNFGPESAELAAEITGTNPIIWQRKKYSHLRLRFEDALMVHHGINRKRRKRK